MSWPPVQMGRIADIQTNLDGSLYICDIFSSRWLYGSANHSRELVCGVWQVDLVIVASSILVLVLESTSFNYVKGFRVLRAIKPLRALTRSAGMLLVFRSVTLSLKAMANVSIVCLLFFVIFAILGVQLFSGRFYR